MSSLILYPNEVGIVILILKDAVLVFLPKLGTTSQRPSQDSDVLRKTFGVHDLERKWEKPLCCGIRKEWRSAQEVQERPAEGESTRETAKQ